MIWPIRWFLFFALTLLPIPAMADEVRVAVASNFADAMEELAEAFSADTGHRVMVSSGSTGKHYAQIRQGAPFDVFLAADEERPARLEREGQGVADTRFTYALGVLVLWSPERAIEFDPAGQIRSAARVAMANPRVAPYGRAAQQAMEALGVWEEAERRAVRGENIAQAYQFVATGNAPLGFVALSQWHSRRQGNVWRVPEQHYEPVVQQAILLRDRPAARALMQFLTSDKARVIIHKAGYELP